MAKSGVSSSKLVRKCQLVYDDIASPTKTQMLLLKSVQLISDPNYINEVLASFKRARSVRKRQKFVFAENRNVKRTDKQFDGAKSHRTSYGRERVPAIIRTPLFERAIIKRTDLDLSYKRAVMTNYLITNMISDYRTVVEHRVPNDIKPHQRLIRSLQASVSTLQNYFNHDYPSEDLRFMEEKRRHCYKKFWKEAKISPYTDEPIFDNPVSRTYLCSYASGVRAFTGYDLGGGKFVSIGHVRSVFNDNNKTIYAQNGDGHKFELSIRQHTRKLLSGDDSSDPIIYFNIPSWRKEEKLSSGHPYAIVVEREGIFRSLALIDVHRRSKVRFENGIEEGDFADYKNFTVSGDSGAPIVDSAGRLVGVHKASGIAHLINGLKLS